MDDVASDLSISKKTIYQFFKNKDELVTSISKDHMAEEKDDYLEIESHSENALDEILQVSNCFRRHMNEINPRLLFELKKYHSDAWKVYMHFKTDFIKNHIKRNIERGISEGYYRAELDADILSTFRVEQVELIFDEQIFPREKHDFADVQMQLFDHFIQGLLTDKGRVLYSKYFTSIINAHT